MPSSRDLDNYENYIVIGVKYWRDGYVPEWHYGSVASKCLDAQMGRDSDSYGNTILYADRATSIDGHGECHVCAVRVRALYLFACPGLICPSGLGTQARVLKTINH